MRALLFLISALLIGLSPATALAHDGAHGEGGSAAAGSFDQSWSPACPPGSGHVCGCGNLSLCEGGAKPIVVARYTIFAAPQCPAGPKLVRPARARLSQQFPPALPRAPPKAS